MGKYCFKAISNPQRIVFMKENGRFETLINAAFEGKH